MSIVLVGSTSGSVTLQEPAVAGTTVLSLPAITGTLAINETGSYTTTATGFTTSPTGTVFYAITGSTITLNIPAFAATSNATTFTLTGLPASLYPTRAQNLLFRTADNSASSFSIALGIIGIGGNITLYKDLSAGAFTASGTKQLATQTVTYSQA